nr:MAG TPA: hypothetical protein [Caudoviricetes sp.]
MSANLSVANKTERSKQWHYLLYVFHHMKNNVLAKKPSRSILRLVFRFLQTHALMLLVRPNRPKPDLRFPLSPLRSIRSP